MNFKAPGASKFHVFKGHVATIKVKFLDYSFSVGLMFSLYNFHLFARSVSYIIVHQSYLVC